MVEYKPGKVYKSFQKPFYFRILNDFCIPVYGTRRLSSTFTHLEDHIDSVDLKDGDIIEVKYFCEGSGMTIYCYLSKLISSGEEKIVNQETCVSLPFIQKNTIIFQDITQSIERDCKINTILYNE